MYLSMHNRLIIDNYYIDTPIIDILNEIKLNLTNGKLKDIKVGKDDIVVTCPHHDNGLENRPDMNIYIGSDPNLQYGWARCFACDFSVPFYKFVAECFDKPADFGKEWLINRYGIRLKEKILIDEPINLNRNKKVQHYYDPEILTEFQSYCPYLQKRKISMSVCHQLNIKYDPKTRSVIFPCFDLQGHLVMLPSRSIDFKRFTLDANVEKPVYCLNEIVKNNIKEAVLTEGPFDTATSWTYGVPAIGTLGTVSDTQIDLINRSGLRHIYLMFDNDDAGRRFTEHVKNRLSKNILFTVVNIPSPYKDINDLPREVFLKLLGKSEN